MASIPAAVVLEGGCECGRNQYAIYMPETPNERLDKPEICFDGSSRSLRANAPPASVFVRVPLQWLHSTTYSFSPDETHSLIRRSYTPRHDPASKRFFCGICSELLSVWTEANPIDEGYIHINWHTLEPESCEALDMMRLLPDDSVFAEQDDRDDAQGTAPLTQSGGARTSRTHVGTVGDRLPVVVHSLLPASHGAVSATGTETPLWGRSMPWFDEILEGSPLSRMRRENGGGISADGRTRVEWEIIEFGPVEGTEDHQENNPRAGAKRKVSEGDIAMRGGH